MKKIIAAAAVLVLLVVLLAFYAFNSKGRGGTIRNDAAKALNERVLFVHKIATAKKELEAAEGESDPNYAKLTKKLNNLAWLYASHGQYANRS